MNKWIPIVCLVVMTGCGGGAGGANKLTTHKVKGKVSLGGNPVAGATVTFSPKTKGNPPAMGLTDAQGIYILTTYDAGDGAVEGDYKVMVYKAAPKQEAAGSQHDPTGKAGGKSAPPASHGGGPNAGKAGGSGSLLGDKYATQDTPIEKSVKAGEQDIPIDL